MPPSISPASTALFQARRTRSVSVHGPMQPRATIALHTGEVRRLPVPGLEAPGPEDTAWLSEISDR
ncbi:hypothetical protein [Streptomyces sp. NBC_00568]|uniref:hypothetical protein n=1 Tax=Streptomyces sp. NBC_00568 TaxID=2975779 RepID=UPI00225690A8|nr:hypothetical protein [Streptomyces sp. NBC_00568]MCX4987441.1 hypothetical protein [Streptomyces sp. NBC_00568]